MQQWNSGIRQPIPTYSGSREPRAETRDMQNWKNPGLPVDKLKELEDLKNSGTITEEEYMID